MAKDLKNPKRALVTSRSAQIAKRARETDRSQIKNPDLEACVIEGMYTKAMPHDSSSLVGSQGDVEILKRALDSTYQEDYDSIPRSGARKQVSPQAAISIELSGADPEGVTMSPCPALSSKEAAGEMIEVYEKCMLRDVPFSVLSGFVTGSAEQEASLQRAIDSLNAFGEDFKGPKENGLVTRKSLFRGVTEGDLVGPYISQFMYLDVPMGNHLISQVGPTKTGFYGITEANYLEIQDGNVPVAQTIDSANKYVFNGSQLGSFVHIDFVYQAHLYAASILLNNGAGTHSAFPSLSKEASFVTNGGPVEIAAGVAEISRHALKAAWVQKWRKHLRLRPEAMAARVVKEKEGVLPAGTVHPDLMALGAATLAAVAAKNSADGGEAKEFLSLQYAEGSPTHPSYPAGHAAIAGACTTFLKLYFADGAWSSLGLSPVHSLDGSQLDAYAEADAGEMTIHGELDKLASNIAIGRNIAGVHYRSDGDKGLELGEKVAIQYFKDLRDMQNESIGKISIVKFDGTTEIV